MVVESLIVVGLVGLAVAGMLWLRRDWAASVVPAQVAVDQLVTAWPTDVPTYTPAATAGPTEPPSTAPPPPPTAAPATIVHTIESGDSLYGIAIKYGVTIDDILAVNDGMTIDSFLGIGQELRVPAPGAQVADAGSTSAPEPTAAAQVAEGSEASTAAAAAPEATSPAATTGGDTPAAPSSGTPGTPEAGAAAGTSGDPTAAPGEPAAARQTDPEGGADGPYGPPLLLSPGHGQRIGDDMPFLRWASAGVLPPGAYYVVLLREAPEGAADADPAPAEAIPAEAATAEWVLTNATGLRLPSSFRPAFGASSTIQWAVGVRRRTNGLLTDDVGLPLGQISEWRTFTWTPGAGLTTDNP